VAPPANQSIPVPPPLPAHFRNQVQQSVQPAVQAPGVPPQISDPRPRNTSLESGDFLDQIKYFNRKNLRPTEKSGSPRDDENSAANVLRNMREKMRYDVVERVETQQDAEAWSDDD